MAKGRSHKRRDRNSPAGEPPKRPLDESPRTVHLTEDDAGRTLAATLRQHCGGSLAAARKLVAARRVQLNGNLCLDDSRKLTAGEVMRITSRSQPKPPTERQIRVVYLDEDLVVFDKPAGITATRHRSEARIHVRRKQLQPTLEELAPRIIARHIYSDKHEFGSDRPSRRRKPRTRREAEELIDRAAQHHRVWAVHRLDRDTSGLILFARNNVVATRMAKMFKQHEVRRQYIAVVLGDCPAQTIDSMLVRDRGDKRRGSTATTPPPPDARRAITHVRVLERIGGGSYTVVLCQLQTGRTHQIRIHLSEAGYMICGERLYNRRLTGQFTLDPSDCPRQALHAARLTLTHPTTNQPIDLKSPLPREIASWLKKVSGTFSDL